MNIPSGPTVRHPSHLPPLPSLPVPATHPCPVLRSPNWEVSTVGRGIGSSSQYPWPSSSESGGEGAYEQHHRRRRRPGDVPPSPSRRPCASRSPSSSLLLLSAKGSRPWCGCGARGVARRRRSESLSVSQRGSSSPLNASRKSKHPSPLTLLAAAPRKGAAGGARAAVSWLPEAATAGHREPPGRVSARRAGSTQQSRCRGAPACAPAPACGSDWRESRCQHAVNAKQQTTSVQQHAPPSGQPLHAVRWVRHASQ